LERTVRRAERAWQGASGLENKFCNERLVGFDRL
jgi:hypothetical protein